MKKVAARRLHQLRGTKGPVWQHQFWDRFVRHEKEYAARFDYMHLNPVRKGLVSKPGEWRWSSYNNFALEHDVVQGCPIKIDYVRLPKDIADKKPHGQNNTDRGYPLKLTERECLCRRYRRVDSTSLSRIRRPIGSLRF